ncbi:MAG: hypothetical protein JRJ80_12800 [Deltaproteobacteria bacterium]|nr:hypothetical protein [Deltaproteobacteria bacterium]MBW2374471.1 hypothetical protein [Deltaproteobacteria bacterium]
MISEDFAFFGFDDTSWDRLVSLFLGESGEDRPRGVLVVVVDAERTPVASFHTATGSLDPATLPDSPDLEALCEATGVGACIVMRERAMADLEDYLAQPIDPDQDFATRVMRFAHVLRELGNGNWLRIWPNPLPDLLLAAAPAAKPAIDFLLPDGHNVVLGVFEDGQLWTGAVLRRNGGTFDVFAGPGAMSEWAGPLGGAWHRDHRVLTRAIERELGPLHIGLFMERSTAQSLLGGRQAGEWAMAFATRDLMVYPLPSYAAAGLGIDVLSGAAQVALQALDGMDSEEILTIAKGFWRGLTDGKGIEGLRGFFNGSGPDRRN